MRTADVKTRIRIKNIAFATDLLLLPTPLCDLQETCSSGSCRIRKTSVRKGG
jgi:hypothetical protein